MLHRLFGSLCVLCHVRLDASGLQLCDHCLGDLPWCEEVDPPDSALAFVTACIAPLRYEGIAARWVVRAKRTSGLVEARVLGTLLGNAVMARSESEGVPLPDALIPVPLSWRRLMRRGQNQAIEIGRHAARITGVRLDRRAAIRTRHTPIQPGRSHSERAQNLADVFACRRVFRGEHLAIVDDVVTSGATVRELARTLRASGAGEVEVWSATRAPAAAP